MLRAIDAIAQANEEAGDTEIMRFIEEDNARWEAAQADRGAQAEIRRLRRDTEVLQARERATETADQLERARTERRQHDTAQDFRHEVKTTIAHGAFTIGRETLNDPMVRKFAVDTAHNVYAAATRVTWVRWLRNKKRDYCAIS